MTDRVPSELVRTAPERIWLQISDDADHCNEPFPADHEGITWCQDSVVACEVKYVRADALDAANERIAQLEAAPTSEEVSQLANDLMKHSWAKAPDFPRTIMRYASELLRRLDRERQALREANSSLAAEAICHGSHEDGFKRCPLAPCENCLQYQRNRAERAEAALAEARKDKERLDWAERNPVEAMGSIGSHWTEAGRGFRESMFNFRLAIDAAIAREGSK